MKSALLTLFVLWTLSASVLAENVRCEIWHAGDILGEYGSAEFLEQRAEQLKGEASVEKRTPSIGMANLLLAEAGKMAGLKQIDYRSCRRITVFRLGEENVYYKVIDGIDSSRVPRYRLYQDDIIIFHEFVIG